MHQQWNHKNGMWFCSIGLSFAERIKKNNNKEDKPKVFGITDSTAMRNNRWMTELMKIIHRFYIYRNKQWKTHAGRFSFSRTYKGYAHWKQKRQFVTSDGYFNKIIDGHCQGIRFQHLKVILLFWILREILLAFVHFIRKDPKQFLP